MGQIYTEKEIMRLEDPANFRDLWKEIEELDKILKEDPEICNLPIMEFLPTERIVKIKHTLALITSIKQTIMDLHPFYQIGAYEVNLVVDGKYSFLKGEKFQVYIEDYEDGTFD